MTTYISGDNKVEVTPENEAAFEAAGWSRVEDSKAAKSLEKDDDK